MTTRDKRSNRELRLELEACQKELEGQLRPIAPIGSRIHGHPRLAEWTKQGYVSQEADGLWLHYTAVCSLLNELRKELEEAKGKLAEKEVMPNGWAICPNAKSDAPGEHRAVTSAGNPILCLKCGGTAEEPWCGKHRNVLNGTHHKPKYPECAVCDRPFHQTQKETT